MLGWSQWGAISLATGFEAPNHYLDHCKWIHCNKYQWNLHQTTAIFIVISLRILTLSKSLNFGWHILSDYNELTMIGELHSTDRRPGERVRQPRRQQAHWWRAHQLWSYIGPLRREANCASWLHNLYLKYLNTFQTLDNLLTMQKQMDTCTFGYHIFCRRHILPIIFWTSHI